jgi:hypothetical protein
MIFHPVIFQAFSPRNSTVHRQAVQIDVLSSLLQLKPMQIEIMHTENTYGVFGLQVGLLLESSGPTSEPTLSFGLNRGTMSSVTALF